jgi:tripartite-type tricarboxylate transporter receptor subunit TctC
MTGRWRAALLGLTFASLLAGPSQAGGYPDHPVRFINGFAPGGPVDTVARIMAQALSDHFGQQFVVENRAGSGGNIATQAAIASPPDGYTVLFSGANNAISASLYKHLPFDFMRDTVPVGMFTEVPNLMVISNALPVKTVQEFIDYCKANPGKISFASAGNGTTVHMSAELFKAMTKMRYAARALSRLGAGDARRDLQQGAGDLRQSADGSATGEGRQRAWPRCHLGQALAERARHSGDRRNRARL